MLETLSLDRRSGFESCIGVFGACSGNRAWNSGFIPYSMLPAKGEKCQGFRGWPPAEALTIESAGKTVAAEVFASVRRTNNCKLAKDTTKVAGTKAIHTYVFFCCPGEPAGSEHFRGVEIVAITKEQMLGLP